MRTYTNEAVKVTQEGKKKKKKAIQHYYLLILENKLFTKHFRREDIDIISMSMD